MKKENITYGKVHQVIGPVVDVIFTESSQLPRIYDCLSVKLAGEELFLEAAQLIGDDIVRCIALGPTEGLARNEKVTNYNHPIEVPVGKNVLGRMFNVLGKPIDGKEELPKKTTTPDSPQTTFVWWPVQYARNLWNRD